MDSGVLNGGSLNTRFDCKFTGCGKFSLPLISNKIYVYKKSTSEEYATVLEFQKKNTRQGKGPHTSNMHVSAV